MISTLTDLQRHVYQVSGLDDPSGLPLERAEIALAKRIVADLAVIEGVRQLRTLGEGGIAKYGQKTSAAEKARRACELYTAAPLAQTLTGEQMSSLIWKVLDKVKAWWDSVPDKAHAFDGWYLPLESP